MRKIICLLVVSLMTLSSLNVSARNVPVDEAKAAAAFYMKLNCGSHGLTADDMVLVHQIDNELLGVPAVYFFNAGRSGWIIMGANTAANAVLAFSECGSIVVEDMPEPMLLLLDDHATIIKAVQAAEEGTKFGETEEWSDLLSRRVTHNTKDNNHILMAEEWDQNGDNDGFANGTTYDMMTPVIDGVHAPVGCVATALAQLCHYYRYPAQPRGKVKYTSETKQIAFDLSLDTVFFDYSKMPDKIISATPEEERREVSELGYMIGVAMSMDYRADLSGASSLKVANTMVSKFKYARGKVTHRRSSFTGSAADMINYSPYNQAVDDSTFLARLRNDLLNNRVVYMDGSSSSGGAHAGGHAWLCCGYRDTNENMYYMNWGWGGHYNAWFNLKTNNLFIQYVRYNFKLGQGIITGIVPPADSTAIDIYAGIERAEDKTVLNPAYPNPAVSSVRLPYSITSDAEMVLYSMDGRVVDNIRLHAGEGYVDVRVSDFPKGMYVYRVNGATGRFVVQ